MILESHLQCAAHEMPIQLEEDQIYFGPLLQELSVKLEKDKEGWYHTHRKYLPHPAKHVSLRGAREDKYTIVDVTNVDKPNGRARILEELEFSRALFEVSRHSNLSLGGSLFSSLFCRLTKAAW